VATSAAIHRLRRQGLSRETTGTLALTALMLSGRVSAFINVAGRRFSLTKWKPSCGSVPRSSTSVVAAADGQQATGGGRGHATRQAASSTLMDIRRYCSARLSPHKIPRRVIVVDRIPLTAGKDGRVARRPRGGRSWPMGVCYIRPRARLNADSLAFRDVAWPKEST
jgi:acyl-CoA synthetase (AMP-forming)/AMP-acid ligase II